MTRDNWLTVAMIAAVIMTAAATLLGPPLAVLVQFRLSQPKPAQDTQTPKSVFQKIRRYADFKQNWPFFVCMFISFLIARIGFALSKDGFNRYAVVLMIVGAVLFIYFGTFFAIQKLIDRFWGQYVYEPPDSDNSSDTPRDE